MQPLPLPRGLRDQLNLNTTTRLYFGVDSLTGTRHGRRGHRASSRRRCGLSPSPLLDASTKPSIGASNSKRVPSRSRCTWRHTRPVNSPRVTATTSWTPYPFSRGRMCSAAGSGGRSRQSADMCYEQWNRRTPWGTVGLAGIAIRSFRARANSLCVLHLQCQPSPIPLRHLGYTSTRFVECVVPKGRRVVPSPFHSGWTGQPASLWETVGSSSRRSTRPVTRRLSAWTIAWKTVRTCSAEESRRNFHVKLERRSQSWRS